MASPAPVAVKQHRTKASSPPSERAKDVRPKTDLQREIDPFYISSIDAMRTVFDVYTTHFNTEAITSYMLAQIVEALVPSAFPFVKEEVQTKLLHYNNNGLAGFTEFVDLIRHAQLAARVSNREVHDRCGAEVARMRLKRELLVNKAMLGTERDAINAALGIMAHRRPIAAAKAPQPGGAGGDAAGPDGSPAGHAAAPQGMASINESLLLSIQQKDSSIAEKDVMIAKLSAQLAEYRPKFTAVEREVQQAAAAAANGKTKTKKGSAGAASGDGGDAAPGSSRTQLLLARGGRSREEVLDTARQLAAEARAGAWAGYSSHPQMPAGGGAMLHAPSEVCVAYPSAYNQPPPPPSVDYHAMLLGGNSSSARGGGSRGGYPLPSRDTYGASSPPSMRAAAARPAYAGSAFAYLTDTLPPSMPLITEEDVDQVLFDRRPNSEKLRTAAVVQTVASSTAGSLATSEGVRMGGASHALQLERRLTHANVKHLPIHGSHKAAAAPAGPPLYPSPNAGHSGDGAAHGFSNPSLVHRDAAQLHYLSGLPSGAAASPMASPAPGSNRYGDDGGWNGSIRLLWGDSDVVQQSPRRPAATRSTPHLIFGTSQQKPPLLRAAQQQHQVSGSFDTVM